MNSLHIRTPHGPLGFVGQIHTDTRRPTLLVVLGSFPGEDQLHHLVTDFAGANVVIARMPGMHGPPWAETTAAGLSEALKAAATHLLGDQPLAVMGVSTGNLLCWGLDLPNIKRRIAVEPFFQTRNLWPFIANSRERMTDHPGNPNLAPYFREYFGITADAVENRDYRHLIDRIAVPTDVLVGAMPLLPERNLEIWPRFIEDEDLETLRGHPLVTVHIGPSGTGHGVGMGGPSQAILRKITHQALKDLVPHIG